MTYHKLVVHCKRAPYDVYIGRASKSAPKGFTCEWGNPFVMKNQSVQERTRVCEAYKEWLMDQPDLVAKAKRELKGRVLGCYCSPLACHGHVLAEVANVDDSDSKSDVDIIVPPPITQTIQTTSGALACLSTCPPTPPLVASTLNGKEGSAASSGSHLVDIGINIHNKQMLKTWRQQVQRAYEANVTTILLTGTSLKCSANSLKLAETFHSEKPSSMNMSLYCTVGIHPHDAKSFQGTQTIQALRSLLQSPLAVAVGECGLDYNRNFSTPAMQLLCFEEQIKLACELKKPLFIHEREAHSDVVAVLQQYLAYLPPVVVHCFTGSDSEAQTYIAMGFYLGFTGTICKLERGRPLRDLLPSVPLNRILLETDAPFMGFVKGRRESEPKDVALVAAKVAEVLHIDVETVRTITTENAKLFFNI